MTRERYDHLLSVAGPIAPAATANYIHDLNCDARELLPREALAAALEDNGVPRELREPLYGALDAANAVPELVELSHVLAIDLVRSLSRGDPDVYFQPRPDCLTSFDRDAFGLLFALLCSAEGHAALRRRGVPEACDRELPARALRRQLSHYVETGDVNFEDYGWDIVSFGCGLFHFDRFYFLPYRWADEPEAWRDGQTGRTTALWRPGVKVRRDGQLDGVNGIRDPEAFETFLRETPGAVTGFPADPDGRIRSAPVTLEKPRWRKVLGRGDLLLGLHVPEGEGYTPEHLKTSCELATAFFDRYYPEYDYKGIWSESWLYDPALGEMLGPERNITRVQRQFYRYPTMEGEAMTRSEVLGDANADYTRRTPATTLEKKLFEAWSRGERSHNTGAFILREDIARVGEEPYRKEA